MEDEKEYQGDPSLDYGYYYRYIPSHQTSFVVVFTLVSLLALYFTRARWMQLLPDQLRHSYIRLPTFNRRGFGDDIERGLTSDTFDLALNNLDTGDTRSGLDPIGAEQVERIMQERGVTFDEARRIRHEYTLAKNGVDPRTGLPLDRKAVFFH